MKVISNNDSEPWGPRDRLRRATGFRRVFVLDGHGGNDQPLRVAAQAAGREEGAAYLEAIVSAVARCLADYERRSRDPEPLSG